MEAKLGLAQSRNVWDKMATLGASEEDWMIKRKEQTSLRDRYKFITYILNKRKLLTEHRKTEKSRWKNV